MMGVRLIYSFEGTPLESDDTLSSETYRPGPGPGFPQPTHQLDPRFPQPSLQYPPVISPVVPETAGFQGPVIPSQIFPQQPPGFPQPQVFPQPQAFTQPIAVTFPSPRVPPFLPDRFQPSPAPDCRTPEGG
jgi:hypothetical protein